MESVHSWASFLGQLTVEDGSAAGLERAVAVVDSLPSPDENQDAINALYRIAFAVEGFWQLERAQSLYGRVLNCAAVKPSTTVEAHYRRALCFKNLAKSAEAIEHFALAAEKGTGSPQAGRLARWELSGLLLCRGEIADIESAERHCYLLLAEADCAPLNRTEILVRRSRCLFSSNHSEAVSAWEEICALVPHLNLAGEPCLVSALFEAAVAAELADKYTLAARFYSMLLERTDLPPHVTANAAYRMAICTERDGMWAESMNHYRTTIRMGKNAPGVVSLARVQLGLLLLAAEEYQEAAELYSDLCANPAELHISVAEAHYRQAFCLFRSGDATGAEEVLRKISRKNATEEFLAKADHLLAEIFESRKEYRSALACYRRLVANAEAEISVKASALQRIAMLRASTA